jgi:hypothetical protein
MLPMTKAANDKRPGPENRRKGSTAAGCAKVQGIRDYLSLFALGRIGLGRPTLLKVRTPGRQRQRERQSCRQLRYEEGLAKQRHRTRPQKKDSTCRKRVSHRTLPAQRTRNGSRPDACGGRDRYVDCDHLGIYGDSVWSAEPNPTANQPKSLSSVLLFRAHAVTRYTVKTMSTGYDPVLREQEF